MNVEDAFMAPNTTMNEKNPVTVIGLGLMGQALAAALLRAGHPTTVWNRTASKADDLVAAGATLAASVAEAVAASPLVILCVTDYAAVRSLGPLGLDGRVVVNLTSGTSADARALGASTTSYLDGAIMAIPQGIGTAEAVILYSGPRAAFDAHEATLGVLAGVTTYLGEDHGLSALHDVAVLSLMWNVLNGFLQGAALLRAAGVDASAFAPLAQASIGTVAGWVEGYAKQIDAGAYPALDATIDTHAATMDHLIHESEALGVSTELPRFVKTLADRAVAAGRGGDGYAAMIEQF
ncbi:NAD(P)-dependent oxidoreductase [Nonomuraea sp. NPDC050556]|uniref:NAD(P)-dependent oxidoreductase n=1 Tax=Nonomuraea sp. NPDC050556 TaxID=3364369 RepID=UPI0037A17C44